MPQNNPQKSTEAKRVESVEPQKRTSASAMSLVGNNELECSGSTALSIVSEYTVFTLGGHVSITLAIGNVCMTSCRLSHVYNDSSVIVDELLLRRGTVSIVMLSLMQTGSYTCSGRL